MFYTCIMASGPRGMLCIGSTDDLARRVYEHSEKAIRGFTARYNVTQLVWFETHESREEAFRSERRLKEWRRAWESPIDRDR